MHATVGRADGGVGGDRARNPHSAHGPDTLSRRSLRKAGTAPLARGRAPPGTITAVPRGSGLEAADRSPSGSPCRTRPARPAHRGRRIAHIRCGRSASPPPPAPQAPRSGGWGGERLGGGGRRAAGARTALSLLDLGARLLRASADRRPTSTRCSTTIASSQESAQNTAVASRGAALKAANRSAAEIADSVASVTASQPCPARLNRMSRSPTKSPGIWKSTIWRVPSGRLLNEQRWPSHASSAPAGTRRAGRWNAPRTACSSASSATKCASFRASGLCTAPGPPRPAERSRRNGLVAGLIWISAGAPETFHDVFKRPSDGRPEVSEGG